MLGWLLAMLGQSAGFPVPVGGAGKLTEALVERLRSRGGTLMTGEPVQRILIDDGTAVGVLTAAGREHQARHVLADVDAPTLYRELVGDPLLPAGLRADLDRFAWDPSTVKINWALDSPIPWTAAEVGRAGTVHLGADLLGVVDYSHALSTHRVPAQPFVLLGQMSTADPTRSPHGTESVWAYTHLPHRAWDAAQVDVCATGVQDLLERHAPGFGDRIIARSVQSPADLAGADANLRLGAINGGTAQIFQQLVLRPTPGLGRPETFVDRLYLAGASAHPGGGVHGACGRNAARAALLRERAATRPLGLGAQRATALLAQGRP
jgi:phytoene dehydrogenase-like protein